MPYLQVDLDGKRHWPMVATGLGIHEAFVAKGFLDLWEMCWRNKSNTVTGLQLECLFAGATGQRVGEVLEGFGFLEAIPDGEYRVRGADKYLRIAEAAETGRIAGGRARASKASRDAKGRLLPSSRHPAKSSRRPAETQLLTPITEHQSPNTEISTLAPAGAERSRFASLRGRLVAAFLQATGSKYGFQGAKDAEALKRIAAFTDDDAEAERRWRAGLAADGFRQTLTLAELAAKWNHHALTTTGPPAKTVDVTRGMVRAESQKHTGGFDF